MAKKERTWLEIIENIAGMIARFTIVMTTLFVAGNVINLKENIVSTWITAICLLIWAISPTKMVKILLSK